jgi:hypothetical protein
MAVNWERGSQNAGPLVADRNLYLDRDGTKVVEEGDAASASQLVAAGHPINQADADRLGLVLKSGKVQQDRAVKIGEHESLVSELDAERKALYESIEQYKRENATKDIPNTMEAARVALETRFEHAVLALNHFVKAGSGKDPLKGESQATALEPEKSEIAKSATKRANEAIAASPTPAELAASAPKEKAEVAPQHPVVADGKPAPEPGNRSNPADVLAESSKPAAKKSSAKKSSTRKKE